MTDEKAARWREERRAAAAMHGELLASRQRAESAQAQELIDAFLRQALTVGPSPAPLVGTQLRRSGVLQDAAGRVVPAT